MTMSTTWSTQIDFQLSVLEFLYEAKEKYKEKKTDSAALDQKEESIRFMNELQARNTMKMSTSLSSAEAEYVAMSLSCRDVIGLNEMSKRIMREEYVHMLKEDSMPARDLALTEE